ncbi:MAG: glycosyl hydrolase family 2 [Ignavibacteriae bacterium]|nr:glycosyl hydrolase family 2 [Ignavibacteriota bacterium]
MLLILLTQWCFAQQQEFRLTSLIADNMVLQRESDVRLWGLGKPGTDVTVLASWNATAAASVQPDGKWSMQIRSPKAGGAYQLTFKHADGTLTINNVLSGEVWLCSGQSNMEMPLRGWPPSDTIMNSAQEIARSANPHIRMFIVQRALSAVPEQFCNGEWQESSPETSPNFSATAYFFARTLYETLKVPIGLIHSSWGGTPVHSWIDAPHLARMSQFKQTVSNLSTFAEGQKEMLAWLAQFRSIDMAARQGQDRWRQLDFDDVDCAARDYPDESWRTMSLPAFWENTEIGSFDGAVWFRKRVEIPAAWVGKNLVVELGPIDDMDETYINGTKVGGYEETGHWRAKRVYPIPASVVKHSTVQIAVRVLDNQGGGGLYGAEEPMVLRPEHETDGISLACEWKYHVAALFRQNIFHVFGQENHYHNKPPKAIDLTQHTPTSLYNGMIAPLVPYGIRGAIWYQGESDTGNPQQYKESFPLMIENWRHDFQVGDFPFYYVQIAPFNYGTGTNSAYLREAQTATLAVKNTGMAATLDIGNATNIHPANKQDVGKRLALWALAKTYGQDVEYSGPLFASMKKVGSAIELSFNHAEGGLVLKNASGFQIAGADSVFKDAAVRAEGNRLIVSHPEIAVPEAVRYAFNNTPEATLFNAEGLPAPSFRTDDWK